MGSGAAGGALAGRHVLMIGTSVGRGWCARRVGTRIVIQVADLPPAEPGTYYQAWLRIDGEIGVSAGAFHLRGGNAPIELWAGVTPDEYPLLTVTLQQEAQTESSGQVVLKGRIGG